MAAAAKRGRGRPKQRTEERSRFVRFAPSELERIGQLVEAMRPDPPARPPTTQDAVMAAVDHFLSTQSQQK